METRHKKYLGLFIIVALVAAFVMFFENDADANRPKHCIETTTVLDEPAFTEEVVHPAVTEVVHHEAVTETTPAVWANWQPNNTQGPQDYVPVWPSDERGSWIVHEQGIPPGHAGPDGVYQQGGGNSPFFYRQAEAVVVIEEAYDETVVVEEEWVESVEHPAVTHEEFINVPCFEEPPAPPVVKPPDLVVETETRSTPSQVVKVQKYASGRVTQQVTNYPVGGTEEGM